MTWTAQTLLSPHFSLAEFIVSDTAERKGINNMPPESFSAALIRTAQGLEAIRVRLGCMPIIVTSGYRCPMLNAVVGGQPGSQHMLGEAADIICPRFGTPTEVATALRGSDIAYDQLIIEFGRWVHVSFKDSPRRMALTIDRDGTRPMFA